MKICVFRKLFVCSLFLAIGTILDAADIENSVFAGKRIAILHEKGKMPEDWDKTTFDISKKLVDSGEIISSEVVQEGKRKGLIRFVVKSDNYSDAKKERGLILDKIGDLFRSQGLPITYHYLSFPENKIFGDKSIGYIITRFESCFYEPYLANGLISQGAIIVKENENPDVKLTIGVDACMSGWELEKYMNEKYKGNSTYITSVNREAGIPTKVVSNTSPSGFGSDLMRAGSSSGTAGLAVASVGLALDLFERSFSSQDTGGIKNIDLKPGMTIDLVRYHVTFEGKGQKKVTFYHTYTGTTQHDKYESIAGDTFIYPMKMLYLNFENWLSDSNTMHAELQTHQKEKDLLKALKILHEN